MLTTSNGGHFWRSSKSSAEVTIVLSLVWGFQKGISCWVFYYKFSSLKLAFFTIIKGLGTPKMNFFWVRLYSNCMYNSQEKQWCGQKISKITRFLNRRFFWDTLYIVPPRPPFFKDFLKFLLWNCFFLNPSLDNNIFHV